MEESLIATILLGALAFKVVTSHNESFYEHKGAPIDQLDSIPHHGKAAPLRELPARWKTRDEWLEQHALEAGALPSGNYRQDMTDPAPKQKHQRFFMHNREHVNPFIPRIENVRHYGTESDFDPNHTRNVASRTGLSKYDKWTNFKDANGNIINTFATGQLPPNRQTRYEAMHVDRLSVEEHEYYDNLGLKRNDEMPGPRPILSTRSTFRPGSVAERGGLMNHRRKQQNRPLPSHVHARNNSSYYPVPEGLRVATKREQENLKPNGLHPAYHGGAVYHRDSSKKQRDGQHIIPAVNPKARYQVVQSSYERQRQAGQMDVWKDLNAPTFLAKYNDPRLRRSNNPLGLARGH